MVWARIRFTTSAPLSSGFRPVMAASFAALMISGPIFAGPPGERPSELLPAPVAPVPPSLDQASVDRALGRLDGIVEAAMERTGVPGVAVAVVYKDDLVFAKGFGVREAGKPEPIDADTVFQLASVSKPIASTVLAALVGNGVLEWDDPIIEHNPEFALSDPYVTKHATFTDLLSHRSGLSTGAGDLLEDLGYDRDTILSRLDQQPLDEFRSSYNYSNFGYTAGAEAAAVAAGQPWEDLAEEVLFEPLGMAHSSYRHADFGARDNKALIHARTGSPGNWSWEAKFQRNADAEAPAGGASGSVNDLARYLRLQLGDGTLDGVSIIDPDALAATHVPQQISGSPSDPASRGHFYGLGWNVGYDDEGRVQLGHSGAFNLGASTNITMLPGEDLGIVVLANGEPVGLAEAVSATFLDVAQHGAPTVDWLSFTGHIFDQMREAERADAATGARPSDPEPARDSGAYIGRYDNDYYGPLTVSETEDGRLAMTLGPETAPTTIALDHIDGDRFVFETIGENAIGLSNAAFEVGADGRASSLTLDFYNRSGLGTFRRS